MNNHIKTRINDEIIYLNGTRDLLAVDVEEIKKQSNYITGNLLLSIMIVKQIESALDILEKSIEQIDYLANKTDDKILSYYLDVRSLEQQLGGK